MQPFLDGQRTCRAATRLFLASTQGLARHGPRCMRCPRKTTCTALRWHTTRSRTQPTVHVCQHSGQPLDSLCAATQHKSAHPGLRAHEQELSLQGPHHAKDHVCLQHHAPNHSQSQRDWQEHCGLCRHGQAAQTGASAQRQNRLCLRAAHPSINPSGAFNDRRLPEAMAR